MLDSNNYRDVVANLIKAVKEDDSFAKQRFLLDNPDLNKVYIYGHTLLHYLTLKSGDNLDVIDFLLNCSSASHTVQSDCNNSICIGVTVFARAVMARRLDYVNYFLDRHNNPPRFNTFNNVVRYGQGMANRMNRVVGKRYELDFDERIGSNTILSWAIWHNRDDNGIEIINSLIRSGGFDLDAQNDNGNTALHYAVLRNLSVVVMLLLEGDVDVEIENEDGDKPVDLVNEFTDSFIDDALKSYAEFLEESEASYSEGEYLYSESESSSEEIDNPKKKRKRQDSFIEGQNQGNDGFNR